VSRDVYPQFYTVNELPVYLTKDNGCFAAWKLDGTTGEFGLDVSMIDRILLSSHGDIDVLSREDFIHVVEGARAMTFASRRGSRMVIRNDALRAVYETIASILAPEGSRSHRKTPEEMALVRVLQKQTHEMFEAEIRERGGHGMPA
jgi:hypothetical protein